MQPDVPVMPDICGITENAALPFGRPSMKEKHAF